MNEVGKQIHQQNNFRRSICSTSELSCWNELNWILPNAIFLRFFLYFSRGLSIDGPPPSPTFDTPFLFWTFVSSDEYNLNPALEWDDEFPGRWHGSLAQFINYVTSFFFLMYAIVFLTNTIVFFFL